MKNKTGYTIAGAFSLALAAISLAVAAYGYGSGWEASRIAGPAIGTLILIANGIAQLYVASIQDNK